MMNRLLVRPLSAVTGIATASAALTACTIGHTVQSCIDWVFFDSPSDAAAEADAVARGRIVDQAATTSYLGMPATTWNVEIDEWFEGAGADEIVVVSLPRSCGDTTDSMAEAEAEAEDLILFLREQDTGWEILTPWQGVIPARSDGGVPATWPDGLYD
jgi:hypothetical protein